MPSQLIDLLLHALSLAEQYEEQPSRSPITLAALQHVLEDAAAEIESIRKKAHSNKSAES